MSRVTIAYFNRRLQVNPNRVFLKRGEHLNWDIRIEYNNFQIERLSVEIYFERSTPFRFGNGRIFEIQMRNFSVTELSAGSADVPGDYKYGVRIRDANDYSGKPHPPIPVIV